MLGKNVVDEELKRGLGLSMNEIAPLLRAGGDASEMKFMQCCRHLWKADGIELMEPFIDAAFNKLPEKSRCVLFQRMLTIVYVAQDGERLPSPPERSRANDTAVRLVPGSPPRAATQPRRRAA
jgi:hypothetical protein